MRKNLNVVSIFAGAGGLSEGFHRKGFNVVSSVEKDQYACDTLRTRYAFHKLKKNNKIKIYYEYLKNNITYKDFLNCIKEPIPIINKEIVSDSIPEITKTIKQNMAQCGVRSIDVFIGGPPCQAYSLVGRARDPYSMEKDPRTMLYKYYIELLKEFKPQVFIFENVPGILSAGKGKLFNDVQEHFENAGYEVDYKLLDASDFMVLQKRKRVILIGWKKKSGLSYPDFVSSSNNGYLVKDLLSDLPRLNPGESFQNIHYLFEPTFYLLESGIRNEKDILIHHCTRPIHTRDREIYRYAINLWKERKERLKYHDLPKKLKTHHNESSFVDRFKVVADDMPYSHTVVAHIAKDGHYYVHPDITQARSLSVREAARLQSFPDNYKFEGPRTAQLTQIGNAVPPLMAEKIAYKIREMVG